MRVGFPHRFSAQRSVVDFRVAVPGGDSIDDLTIGENITVPMEMGVQIRRRLGRPRAHDERQLQLVEGLEVRGRQHARISGHHHRRAGKAVALQKAGDDRHDGGGLGERRAREDLT